MKTRLLCWLPECAYRDVDTKKLLINNNIAPLLDSSFSTAIWEAQGKPDWVLRYASYGSEVGLQPYLDELISTGKQSELDWFITHLPNLVIGETSLETIQQLVDAGCKNITYTCYGWHLFRIAGINIRMPFTSQLNTWEYLERKYNCIDWDEVANPIEKRRNGKYHQLGDDDWFEKEDNEKLFNFCWIMLDQVKSFKKLIQWCKDYNKTIGLVAPDSKQNNPQWIYKQLTKFIKVYKEVTE